MCVVHRQSIDLKDKDVSFWRRTTHISRFCVMLGCCGGQVHGRGSPTATGYEAIRGYRTESCMRAEFAAPTDGAALL
jgi:hypothetical protein